MLASSCASRPSAAAATASPRRAGAASRSLALRCRAERVLIANTKGGGHAFLGLYLAKKLLSQGHEVTILNDGDEVRKTTRVELREEKRKKKKEHFNFLLLQLARERL